MFRQGVARFPQRHSLHHRLVVARFRNFGLFRITQDYLNPLHPLSIRVRTSPDTISGNGLRCPFRFFQIAPSGEEDRPRASAVSIFSNDFLFGACSALSQPEMVASSTPRNSAIRSWDHPFPSRYQTKNAYVRSLIADRIQTADDLFRT